MTDEWQVVFKIDHFNDVAGQEKKAYKGAKLSKVTKPDTGEVSYILLTTDTNVNPAAKVNLKLSLAELAIIGLRATAEVQKAEIKDDYKPKTT